VSQHTICHHTSALNKPFTLHLSESDVVNDGKETKDTSLQDRLACYLPTIRTAFISICAGSLSVILASILLFRYSLENGDQTIYQIGRSSSSVSSFKKDKGTSVIGKKQAVDLYRLILQELDETYVDPVDTETLFETTTRGVLSTLDPYTEYVSPKDIMKRQQSVGIGAFVMKPGIAPADTLDGKSVSSLLSRIPTSVKLPNKLHSQSQNKEGYRVLVSLEGAAYDAGLRVGDEIIEVDNESIVGDEYSLEKVREKLQGDVGTSVKLTIKRPGVNKIQTIDVERKQVGFPDIPYYGTIDSHRDIGYIKLHRFGLNSGVKVKEAIDSMQSDNKNMKGIILDLRDNTGGELLPAVQIASFFLPEDTYLGSSSSSKGKDGLYPDQSYYSGKLDVTQYGYKSEKDFIISHQGNSDILDVGGKQIIYTDKTNIVILVNKKTASASEFLAGALQDYDKAVIIGTDKTTYGKGIGQREIRLPSGGGAMKLTYAEFQTPSGRCVQPKPKSFQKNESKEFRSKNGRLIKNRSGIQVDEKVTPETSVLSDLLSSSGAYFDFATDYSSKHKSDFVVDDSTYKEFKSYILKEQRRGNIKLEEEFDSDKLIERLSSKLKSSKSSTTKQSISKLQEDIVGDLLTDLDIDKDIISHELEANILSRLLPDSELTKRRLPTDELVQEAVKIIDSSRYNLILNR